MRFSICGVRVGNGHMCLRCFGEAYPEAWPALLAWTRGAQMQPPKVSGGYEIAGVLAEADRRLSEHVRRAWIVTTAKICWVCGRPLVLRHPVVAGDTDALDYHPTLADLYASTSRNPYWLEDKWT